MFIYPISAVNSTWQNMFAQYQRVPSVAPAWFRSLVDGCDAPTGVPAVDVSLVLAWREFANSPTQKEGF